jgi:hypothetical protein
MYCSCIILCFSDEGVTVDLLHRAVPARHTDEGLRALSNDRPISPESMKRYRDSRFGDALDEVYEAIKELAKSLTPSDLADKAYQLYERFCPEIPPGKRGWGAPGKLHLDGIRKMVGSKETQSSKFKPR